jgi:uracil-DNA glycosylase
MERKLHCDIGSLESTRLVDNLVQLQQQAIRIKPPSGTELLPARGGLAGPAFFPEGLGLSELALRKGTPPSIMAIGHNFGCADYRQAIQAAGREDDKATWRNLDSLLIRAGSRPELCFRTNWFVGLLPGKVQVGEFLRYLDLTYEEACNRLLVEQIKLVQPKVILILGPQVARRAYQVIPALAPWRRASRWNDIDGSSIGHSPRKVNIPIAGISANIAALLHPSFGAANQSRRMKNMLQPTTEIEIVRAALQS